MWVASTVDCAWAELTVQPVALQTKTYTMIDEDDPILEHAEGTDIKWKQGKNLTVKASAAAMAHSQDSTLLFI